MRAGPAAFTLRRSRPFPPPRPPPMSAAAADAWVHDCRGAPPAVAWAFTAEADLVAVRVAREGGRTLVADAGGGLYRLDPAGRLEHLQRGLRDLTALAFADAGTGAACAFGDDTLGWIEPDLKVKWTRTMPAAITALAVDPHGRHAAVALESSDVVVVTNRKKRLVQFSSLRPLASLHFLATEPTLVGAAADGFLGSFDLRGRQGLDVKTFANCGDLAVTGDGGRMALAAYNLGIQRLDADGRVRDTLAVGGTPSRVALPFAGAGPLAAATQERQLFRLAAGGEIDWAAAAPDDVVGVALDAAGDALTVGFAAGRVVRLTFGGI